MRMVNSNPTLIIIPNENFFIDSRQPGSGPDDVCTGQTEYYYHTGRRFGFSDLGCFGGEIHTPVLDKLAKNGVRMTQMYNSARSCPSRANLLTGLYPHQTGLGHMDGSHPAWPKGYSGFRSNSDNVTIAEVLKDAGYFTAMSGKWHLGNKSNPILRGFQEYYGLLGGFNSFWNPAVYTVCRKTVRPDIMRKELSTLPM